LKNKFTLENYVTIKSYYHQFFSHSYSQKKWVFNNSIARQAVAKRYNVQDYKELLLHYLAQVDEENSFYKNSAHKTAASVISQHSLKICKLWNKGLESSDDFRMAWEQVNVILMTFFLFNLEELVTKVKRLVNTYGQTLAIYHTLKPSFQEAFIKQIGFSDPEDTMIVLNLTKTAYNLADVYHWPKRLKTLHTQEVLHRDFWAEQIQIASVLKELYVIWDDVID
jgi:hypothetical protein